MNDSQKETHKIWSWVENILILIFIIQVSSAFFFNFLHFAWQANNKWLINFVYSTFGLTVWAFKLWGGILTLVLILFSTVSFVLLVLSIVKPEWFKKTFRVKYWYGIFSAQIVTWILIYNI